MEVEDVINSRSIENVALNRNAVDTDSSKPISLDLEIAVQPAKPETLVLDSETSNRSDDKTIRPLSRCSSRSKSRDSNHEDKALSRSRSRSPIPNSVNNGSDAETRENGTIQSSGSSGTCISLPFFTGGPVFPARHTRDLELAQHVKCDAKIGEQQALNDQGADIIKSAATGLPSFLHHDHIENKISSNGNLEDNSPEDAIKEPDFLHSSFNNQNDVMAPKETSVSSPTGKGELESESLAPLSASFFNCQYQTPSWIDDPLIGVPASAMENKNTHRKTGADMRILTAYMRSLNEMRLPEAIPPAELDKYLSSFFLVVRKADGSEYEPCSLRAMLASIERYLRFKNYPLSLTRDSAFSNMRNVLKLKQQTLRSIGKGQKTASEVSPSSLAREGKIAHLFKTQEMGPYTPSSVVFTLCFYFCMYLKLRKSTENKKLLWGDISLLKDESGREFLTFSSQMLRRNQGSSKVNFRQRNYRVWADPSSPEKDPVTIYKFYAQKRPASTNTNFSPFYLGVNVLFPTQGQPWYRPAAMGINKLNEMVRQIRDITGVRTTSDFQAPDSQSKEKVVLEMSSKEHANGHELVHNTMERQELESRTIKTEVLDGEDDEDSCSNLAIDFSQEAQASPMGAPSTTDVMSALTMQHTVSEGDNSNDSFQRHLQQGLMAHINGVAGHNIRPGQFGQDEDLDLTTNGSSPPDSPLNCSTKDRNVEAQMEEIQHASSPMLMEPVSVDQAKQQLMYIVRKMEPTSLVEFEHWLRAVKFEADPFSGQIVYKEDERSGDTPSLSVKATSSCGSSGANIVLNISLSQKALQGDCPITLSAEASPLTSRERDSPVENSKPALPHGKLASPHSSALSSPKTSASSSSKLQNVLQLDAPLDLATSPLSKSGKSSSSSSSIPPGSNFWSTAGSSSFPTNGRPLLTSLFANNNTTKTSSSGSNGNNSSTTAGLDSSPLAKRLRLSAEQAEAYTSASILASLSSASMANERLRLHLMQGLSAGTTPSYGLDPHTAAGLLDLAASSEVMRSQLLQHYGMKAEPK